MPSVSRNSPCPCGSGKKYKRCCIDKPVLTQGMIRGLFDEHASKQDAHTKAESQILKKYISADFFKVLSYLHLQPTNHGKNIRLENLVTELIRDVRIHHDTTNFTELLRSIKKIGTRNWAEDPPEEFFTENIIFENDNHIAFPGISTGAPEIVQGLIHVIQFKNGLPETFKVKVKEGLRLILSLHTSIARALKLTHRMFEEQIEEELTIPDESMVRENINLFSWTMEEMDKVSEALNIPNDTIDQFIFDSSKHALNFQDPNQNPLLQYPFVRWGDEVILLLPTVELACLNDFIIRQARTFNCLDALLEEYEKHSRKELLSYFGRMHWHPQKFIFSGKDLPTSFLLDQNLWRIDINKLVYVTMVTENPDHTIDTRHRGNISMAYYKKVEAETAAIKKEFPNHQVLVVCIINKSRSLGVLGLALQRFKNSEFQLFFGIQELQVLTRVWEFDRLTLWKYAKYLDVAESKMEFAPLQTHYSKFKWYKRNDESFFDPDEKPFTMAMFGFEIESEIKRQGVMKMDKIGIHMPGIEEDILVPCYRKDEYYPSYISQAVHYGHFHSCFLKYTCPIWFIPASPEHIGAEIYINGFLYWLNEMYHEAKDFINQLGSRPVLFSITLDKEFQTLRDLSDYDDRETNIKYQINKESRVIHLEIPIGIVQFLSRPNNEGEQHLMAFTLDMLGLLMEATGTGKSLDQDDRNYIVQNTVPLGPQKMMIIATGDRDLCVAEIDIDDPRMIPKCDVSHILQNQVEWLGYKTPIQVKIPDNAGKMKLFEDLVSLHYKKLFSELKEYDGLSLLLFLMGRHESLIQDRSFRKINYPVRQTCYGKYYDVYKKFSETERELTFSLLAMRVLIEFVACKLPTGKKQISDDNADMLLAITGKVIQYGSLYDEIKYDIRRMEVGLLPSGRIGIDLKEGNKEFEEFTEKLYGEEFDSYRKNFKMAFHRRSKSGDEKVKQDEYLELVNSVFKEKWGVGLYDIPVLSHVLAYYLFSKNKSIDIISEKVFIELLKTETDFSESEIVGYVNQLCFLQRDDILSPPEGYAKSDTFPWRYNRRLSYLIRPIIRLKDSDGDKLIISARHLWVATENLVSGFGMGTLKVDKDQKELQQLLAKQNVIKGNEYRNEVFSWLTDNCSNLKVIEHEVKISRRGFFKTTEDKGDIDILAIDHERKIIYSIECKNTHQSKVAYEFRLEIDNYLGKDGKPGMIEKHIKRDVWLRGNHKYVVEKLGLDPNYRIVSLVVTRHILPTTTSQLPPIPIVSFYELTKFGLDQYTDPVKSE